jgi:hypothetical protein
MVASFDACKDDVRADVEICRRTRRTDGARGVQIAERRPDGLSGRDNVNAQVDDLITTGVLRRVLAFTELKFSNSMIEAWWRSLKHQWLFLHPLDSVTTVRRPVAFYVDEHNRVLPHSAFRGQTPDEMYYVDRRRGNISESARALGLTRRGLYLKLRRLGLAARADVDIQYLDTK